MLRRVRTWVLAAALLAAASALVQTGPHTSAVTSPSQQFGAAIGDDDFLATYTELETYWQRLDRESDRLRVLDIGTTEEGRRQWMAVVSAPENLEDLDRYRAISRRLARAEGLTDAGARAFAAEGKAIVCIAGGLHGTEVLGAQQLIETVYRLVSRNDAETTSILRNAIVLVMHANPDGHELAAGWYMREPDPARRTLAGLPRLYHKYAGHDNNRDFYMMSQAETMNMSCVLYRDWLPQIVYDHHQAPLERAVMMVPPFREPAHYLFDPLVPAAIDSLGAAMRGPFAAEGKDGITAESAYSAWWNGGLRTSAYFHNQIGLLTETAGGPTPLPGTRWRFRDAVEYSVTANLAVLDAAARGREPRLYNAYRMGRHSIERGGRDSWTASPHRPEGGAPDPRFRDARGYILPADQPDFPTATKFVNALLNAGVTVWRATEPFAVSGTAYPAGSYVVKTAQAFRPHVLDMFEPQDHPDDASHPDGAPRAPHDATGWTLAFQMGGKSPASRGGRVSWRAGREGSFFVDPSPGALEVVYPPALDAGSFRSRFDVLILPSEATPGRPLQAEVLPDPASLPAELRARVGEITARKTMPELRRFVEAGGTLVAIGRAAAAARYLGVPVSDPVSAAAGIRPIAWFASASPLRSGRARGQGYLQGAAAAVEAPIGAGRVFLFGPEITFRGQPHGTFKLLFNSILYSTADPMRTAGIVGGTH